MTYKPRILVFVPAYNCEKQIARVIDQLEKPWVVNSVSKVVVIDNRSTDHTSQVVLQKIRVRNDDYIQLLLNNSNYGLGGSHKVAFQYAYENRFDWIVVLHGDDQGSIDDFRSVIENPNQIDVDCILGSRFMRGSSAQGYSRFRIFGNLVFNFIYSVCLRAKIHDLGSGLNMYKVSSLITKQYFRYPDNLTFNCVMLCSQVISCDKIVFIPITWREDDQISNVKLFRQSIQTLAIALRALRLGKSFPSEEHRKIEVPAYTWSEKNE